MYMVADIGHIMEWFVLVYWLRMMMGWYRKMLREHMELGGEVMMMCMRLVDRWQWMGCIWRLKMLGMGMPGG